MTSDVEILRRAKEREDDPRRPKAWKSWEHHTVGATRSDVKRLEDEGYVCVASKNTGFTRYLLTQKGRDMVFSLAMEREFERVPAETVLDAMSLIVGFEDLKQLIADSIASQRKINHLLEGPPACAKSLLMDAVRSVCPGAFMAFGSRTSAAGLSDVLFEMRPNILLLDECDKMRHDVYAVLLGLMEKGEILETKSKKTRGITLSTSVIAGCNSSKKFTPEFLSRFAFHAHFPEYTRQQFIDVVIGMLARAEGCPPEVAELIGTQVYDMGLGDVRKAKGIWQLMKEPSVDEVKRLIRLSITYGPQNDARKPRRPFAGARLPGMG